MPLSHSEIQVFRKHLIESLTGKKAHITFDRVVEDFPLAAINKKVEGIPHSPYDLVEHMRLAQADIIDFIKNPDYQEMDWPDDYWPKAEGTEKDWKRSIQNFLKDRDELVHMIEDDSLDLFQPLSHGNEYNVFRQILIMANHNSYHTGQLMQLKRALAQ
jgi:hypothetical protein